MWEEGVPRGRTSVLTRDLTRTASSAPRRSGTIRLVGGGQQRLLALEDAASNRDG